MRVRFFYDRKQQPYITICDVYAVSKWLRVAAGSIILRGGCIYSVNNLYQVC